MMRRELGRSSLRKLLSALFQHQEGSSLVETAISFTVLSAMMIGIMQTSIALYTYHFTAEAARLATRYAIVRGSTSCANTPALSNCGVTAAQITSYVQGLSFPGIKGSKVSVTPTWCPANSGTPATWGTCSASASNAPGNLVKVVVTYPLVYHVPFSSNLSLNVGSTSQMVISQ